MAPQKEPALVVQTPMRELRVKLSGPQWAALWLAGATGAAIVVVTAIVLLMLLVGLPPAPALPADPEGATRALADYKTISSVVMDRATALFELIVVKTFLPVFTAILGFLFGSRVHAGSGDGE